MAVNQLPNRARAGHTVVWSCSPQGDYDGVSLSDISRLPALADPASIITSRRQGTDGRGSSWSTPQRRRGPIFWPAAWRGPYRASGLARMVRERAAFIRVSPCVLATLLSGPEQSSLPAETGRIIYVVVDAIALCFQEPARS